MLLEEFDCEREAVINPDMLVKKREDFPEVNVSCKLGLKVMV